MMMTMRSVQQMLMWRQQLLLLLLCGVAVRRGIARNCLRFHLAVMQVYQTESLQQQQQQVCAAAAAGMAARAGKTSSSEPAAAVMPLVLGGMQCKQET
jgi:hypothetical protein